MTKKYSKTKSDLPDNLREEVTNTAISLRVAEIKAMSGRC